LREPAADDGYEPTRTVEASKQLYEKDQVFGIVGNVGTPTAMVAMPYALEQKMLFFGAFTGADLLRRASKLDRGDRLRSCSTNGAAPSIAPHPIGSASPSQSSIFVLKNTQMYLEKVCPYCIIGSFARPSFFSPEQRP
jgi:hypothetical protein